MAAHSGIAQQRSNRAKWKKVEKWKGGNGNLGTLRALST